MEITVPDRKEWFTTSEFAAGVKTKPNTFTTWLRKHPEFVAKYGQKIGFGEKKPQFKWHWSALAEYVALKNTTYKGNRFDKSVGPTHIEGAKENLAKIANQQIASQTTQDPILASLQAMVEMRQRQLALDSKIETLEKRLEQTLSVATSPVPVTNGQRQFLNDRVKKYCMTHDLPFHVIWRQIHEHIGVAGVHNFEFKHYQAAIKYVEKMYIETGLVW